MNENQARKVSRDVEAGRLTCFCAKVSVTLRHSGEELASEYLGACFYKNAKDFMDHFGHGITSLKRKLKRARKPERIIELQEKIAFFDKHGHTPTGSYFKDMVRNVIRDAREEMNKPYRKVTLRAA